MALRAFWDHPNLIGWTQNSITIHNKLLEPISKEIHVDLENNYKVYYPTWWIDSSKPRPDYEMNKDFFIDDIYKDKIFYDKY